MPSSLLVDSARIRRAAIDSPRHHHPTPTSANVLPLPHTEVDPNVINRRMRHWRLICCVSAQKSYASDAPIRRHFPLFLSCSLAAPRPTTLIDCQERPDPPRTTKRMTQDGHHSQRSACPLHTSAASTESPQAPTHIHHLTGVVSSARSGCDRSPPTTVTTVTTTTRPTTPP